MLKCVECGRVSRSGNRTLEACHKGSIFFAHFGAESASLEIFEEGLAALFEPFFEPLGAITNAAGPGLGPVPIAAILSVVGIFDAQQLEILFPIGTFLLQRSGAKAGLDPMRRAVLGEPRLLHIVHILVARDRTTAKAAVLNGLQERALAAGFHFCFDQIAHNSTNIRHV